MIGVSGQDDISEMASFVTEFDMDGFEHIADVTDGLWRAFDISAQPSFVFINDNGSIVRHIGALEQDEIAEQLDLLIAS